MNTHSHAAYTWLLMGGTRAARYGALGAVLPDLPYTAKALALIARRRRSTTRAALAETLDFAGDPAWTPDLALHSLVPAASLLLAYRGLGLQRYDPHGAARAFLTGWAAHNLVDLGLHASDARPHLWPLSSRRWRSPLSYWERDRHAVPVLVGEHAGLALLAVAVTHRRRSRRRRRLAPR
jgi:hypothetical protein